MIENVLVFKNKKIQRPYKTTLGIAGENEQEKLVFSIADGFIDGTCYLELEFPNEEKGYLTLEKDTENECYYIEVKNSLLAQAGQVQMQLKIVQGDTEVWKCGIFTMFVVKAINATETIEDDYPDFVATFEARMDKITEDLSEQVDTSIQEALANPHFTTFEVNENMELVMNNEYEPKNCDFDINENGELEVEING